MNKKVGLWIDHRKSMVVAMKDEGEEVNVILSKVEKQLRRTGDSPMKGSFESSQVPADDRRQRAFTGHLNVYYDAIISCIGDAKSILLFGPGEAKNELKARLAGNHRDGCIVGVEAAGKMTKRQISAKVRDHYAAPGGL